MFETIFAFLIPESLFVVGSYLIWRKWRTLASLGMFAGFLVSWVFRNLVYFGAIYIYPEIKLDEHPSQEAFDGISFLSNIVTSGYYVAALCFLIFAFQFSKLESEKSN